MHIHKLVSINININTVSKSMHIVTNQNQNTFEKYTYTNQTFIIFLFIKKLISLVSDSTQMLIDLRWIKLKYEI